MERKLTCFGFREINKLHRCLFSYTLYNCILIGRREGNVTEIQKREVEWENARERDGVKGKNWMEKWKREKDKILNLLRKPNSLFFTYYKVYLVLDWCAVNTYSFTIFILNIMSA